MQSHAPEAASIELPQQLPKLEELCFVKRVGTYKGFGNPIVVVAFNSRSKFSHDSLRVVANAQTLLPMVYFLAVSSEYPSDLQEAVHGIPYLNRINVASDVQGYFATFMQRNSIILLPATMVFNSMQRLMWSGHAQSQNFVYALQRLRVSSRLPVPPILTNDVLQLPILPISERITNPSWAFGKGPDLNMSSNRNSDDQMRQLDGQVEHLPPLAGAGTARIQSMSRAAPQRSHQHQRQQLKTPPQRAVSSFQIRHSEPADSLNKAFGEILIHSERIYPACPYKPGFVPDNPMNDKIGMERLFSMSSRLLRRIQ